MINDVFNHIVGAGGNDAYCALTMVLLHRESMHSWPISLQEDHYQKAKKNNKIVHTFRKRGKNVGSMFL